MTSTSQSGSTARYVGGVVLLIAAAVTLLGGGVSMVRALESGGYGTSSINRPLVMLAGGGGLLAIGVSLLIWELSVRYNIRH